MTTIAWRGAFVAADTRVTRGDVVLPERAEKLWRVNATCVAAFSGSVWALEGAKRWLATANMDDLLAVPGPKLKDALLVVFWPERIVEFGDDGETTVNQTRGFYAWGSGLPVAFGALAAGASAERAVEIASEFDAATGGEVVVMPIREGANDG